MSLFVGGEDEGDGGDGDVEGAGAVGGACGGSQVVVEELLAVPGGGRGVACFTGRNGDCQREFAAVELTAFRVGIVEVNGYGFDGVVGRQVGQQHRLYAGTDGFLVVGNFEDGIDLCDVGDGIGGNGGRSRCENRSPRRFDELSACIFTIS